MKRAGLSTPKRPGKDHGKNAEAMITTETVSAFVTNRGAIADVHVELGDGTDQARDEGHTRILSKELTLSPDPQLSPGQ
jgi:hypothetical protein